MTEGMRPTPPGRVYRKWWARSVCLQFTAVAYVGAWAKQIATDAIGTTDAFAPFARKLQQDLLVLGGNASTPVLAECTEISTRVHLDEHKAVKNSQLFTAEYLPAESILAASLSLASIHR